MDYRNKILKIQKDLGISDKKMGEHMGISLNGYARKKSEAPSSVHKKFTEENYTKLIKCLKCIFKNYIKN